ncbi:MAG: hemerythrin domain-containing protein [Gemmatimonadaceae bacterium]|nr:hemerythrin domain-containing protein [Gemmatimonadaceae bacterium]
MRELNIIDPVLRQPERGNGQQGISPMDPPDAFAPPGLDGLAPSDMHPFLQELTADHARLASALDTVEAVIQSVAADGFSSQADHALMHFLQVFDQEFVRHSREEEARLFPLLHERLIADGEHSRGETITTSVKVMLDEHLKAVQLAAVVLNLLRLGTCLPDERSARLVINVAFREATNLVELLRLHMFREDNIVFAAANRLIAVAELDAMRQAGVRSA